jgi:hypothetical protein
MREKCGKYRGMLVDGRENGSVSAYVGSWMDEWLLG